MDTNFVHLVDASTLTDSERAELGITRKLPRSLSESLKSLEKDTHLQKLLGADLVRHYINVKMGETKWLSSMGDESRRIWVIERY